jgi:hypothetical protein
MVGVRVRVWNYMIVRNYNSRVEKEIVISGNERDYNTRK